MRDDVVIRADGVSKMYNVSAGESARYRTLREALTSQAKQTWSRIATSRSRAGSTPARKHEFWSLRDVSFEVRRGEVFGIIGRNGAGKSTLLKILSRITPPTTGRVEIAGRVASLLEVGTGFHPELTGRENIFLNGAILGMRRAEIVKVFDEIVEFAGISNFIDTPVKRYSSGMYVRLAFAVAAHLDPEILILDEVLAVGDAGFQRKCFAKMDEIARSNHKTIIVVSHGMGTITSMCNRAMLLEQGCLIEIGAPVAVVEKYLAMDNQKMATVDYTGKDVGDELATLIKADVQNDGGESVGSIDIGQSFQIKMIYRLNVDLPNPPVANFHFRNSSGQIAFISSGKGDKAHSRGVYESVCHVPADLMNNDSYSVDLALTHFANSGVQTSFYEKAALTFVVTESSGAIETHRHGYGGVIPGAVRPRLEWQFRTLR